MADNLPDMGKQIGPLPLGAWVIIVAAGVGIAIYTRQQSAGSEPIVEDDIATEDISSPAGVGEGPGWTYVGPPQNMPTEEEFEPITNAEWANYAAARMIAETSYSPALVIGSITRYLRGAELDSRQYAVVEATIRRVGPPPFPRELRRHSPGSSPTTPPDRPPKPPPAPGGRGDWHWIYSPNTSLKKIAKQYYGGDAGERRWREIFEANKKGANRPGPSNGWMRNPEDIRLGKWLFIPGPTRKDPQRGQGRTRRQERARDSRVENVRERRQRQRESEQERQARR